MARNARSFAVEDFHSTQRFSTERVFIASEEPIICGGSGNNGPFECGDGFGDSIRSDVGVEHLLKLGLVAGNRVELAHDILQRLSHLVRVMNRTESLLFQRRSASVPKLIFHVARVDDGSRITFPIPPPTPVSVASCPAHPVLGS